jgi:hypothetical protein
MVIGLLGSLLASIPFWMIELPVNLGFPSSRLTIAFMLGVSIFLAGALGILPLPRWTKLVILGLSVSLAAGFQFQTANTFRRDNDTQNTLFWQMTWRIPQLEPGTALLINYLPVHFSTDNSLTGALNWIYSSEDSSVMMPYYLYYPSMRLGTSLPYLEEEQSISQNYLAATFTGNTAQVLALNFEPPACLRVLDPYLDAVNIMLPEDMRYAAEHSTRAVILSGDEIEPVTLESEIFGPEIPHGWCYYFEKGDLARQQGDWELVASIGDDAFALNDYPNDPSERIPFIEGYAHVGRWTHAVEQSHEAYLTDLMGPVLCRLWERIDESTEPSADKDSALRTIRVELECE